MHVYFEFSQPTDPNIRPYNIKFYDFRAVGGNIKPLPIKFVVINQKTIEVIYKCKMAAACNWKNTVVINGSHIINSLLTSLVRSVP